MTRDEKREWLQKALLVPDETTPPADAYLPKPIADELIKQIVEKNYMRKVFASRNIPRRTLTVPIMDYELDKVHQVALGAGVDDTKKTIQSYRAIVLETGKLAAYSEVEIDDIDDSSMDVVDDLMENFALAFARVEEKAMLAGTDRDRTSPDPLKIFKGIYTIAADPAVCATTPVEYDATKDFALSDAIADAIKELGLFGQNGNLVLFCGNGFANKLRKDRAFRGDMGGTVIKDGKLPVVWGVTLYETSYLPTDEAVLMPKNEAVIGQGRGYKVVRDDDLKNDKIIFVAFERLDFQLRHKRKADDKYEALVLIQPNIP